MASDDDMQVSNTMSPTSTDTSLYLEILNSFSPGPALLAVHMGKERPANVWLHLAT